MSTIEILGALLICLLLFKLTMFLSRRLYRKTSEAGPSNECFDYDVVIVGSGILGSSLAAVLARDGRKVAVIERNPEMPERFVGELLQPGGIRALRKLGLQDCIKDIDAQNVLGYLLYGHNGEDKVELTYPLDSEGYGGLSLNNGRLVMALRKAAMSEENVTFIEGTVHDLIEAGDAVIGVKVERKDEQGEKIIKGKLTVVADGCFSQLRKRLVKDGGHHLSSIVTGRLENCPGAKFPFIVVLLSHPDPVFMYSIDSKTVRVMVDMRQKVPTKDLPDYFAQKICPQLPEPYRTYFADGMSSGSPRSMPTNSKPAAAAFKRGVLLLGDALNTRHPITASGMTVAFEDVVLLRRLLADVADLSDYEKMAAAWKKFLSARRRHAFVMNSLANIFFQIMAPNDEWLRRLQDSYLKFVSLDSKYIRDAVQLLTGLNTRAYSLLKHLVCVTLYSAYLPFKSKSQLTLLGSVYKSFRVLGKVCTCLLPLMWPEVKQG